MTDLLDDAALLAALGEALDPEPATPPATDLDALRRALDERIVSVPVLPAVTIVPLDRGRPRSGRGRTLRRLRHPVAVAAAAAVLATGGVAAAAVATDHLPGPTRAVAYDLGLPVMSPALVTARGTLADLESALGGHDDARARSDAALLRSELALLSASDRATLEPRADAALARADALGPAPADPAGGAATGPAGSSTLPTTGGDGERAGAIPGTAPRSSSAGSGEQAPTAGGTEGPASAGTGSDGASTGGTPDTAGASSGIPTTESPTTGSSTTTAPGGTTSDDGSDTGSRTSDRVATAPTTTLPGH